MIGMLMVVQNVMGLLRYKSKHGGFSKDQYLWKQLN